MKATKIVLIFVLVAMLIGGCTRSATKAPVPGPAGPQGPAGKDGYTPIYGVDYFDGEDGVDGEDFDPNDPEFQTILEQVVAEQVALAHSEPESIVEPIADPAVMLEIEESAKRPSDLFQTPVKCEKSFNDASSWLVCEPGVILDNTTAWTIPSTKDTWYSNVPEGAFAYYSLGQGKITVDGYQLVLPYKEGHNHLVLIRGRIDDGKIDTDRNLTAEVTDFVPGHAIWSYMPKGAYVSMNWFRDQLVASTTENYTNCGALGCSNVTIVLFDVDTHFVQRFAVEADDLSTWTKIQ